MPALLTYLLPGFLFWAMLLFPGRVASQATVADSAAPRQGRLLIGVSLTATGFYGDLNYSPTGIFSSNFLSFYPGLNLCLRSDGPRRLFPMLNLGVAQLVVQNPDLAPVPYSLDGPDPQVIYIQPNTYAQTLLVYGEAGLHLNLIRPLKQWRPYLQLCLGVMSFTPEDSDGIPLVRKKSTRAPGEATFEAITFTLPLSAGVAFRISDQIHLDLAYTYRLVGTDYLDNIAELGLKKGNDQLHMLRFGLNFRVKGK